MSREILNSIKATLYDRVSSPLYGTFAFVWALSNWKIFYITFFADEVFLKNSTRLDYIVGYFSKQSIIGEYSISAYFTHLLLLPLLWALIIILLFPKLLIEVDKITLDYKKKRRVQKQKIEEERLLSVKESLDIINKNAELEENFAREMKKQSDKQFNLTESININTERIKETKKEFDRIENINISLKEEIGVKKNDIHALRNLVKSLSSQLIESENVPKISNEQKDFLLKNKFFDLQQNFPSLKNREN